MRVVPRSLWRCGVGAALGVLGCLGLLSACRPLPPVVPPVPSPTPTPVPVPTPPPPPYVPNKRMDVGRIFNGMQYKVTLETERGGTATLERGEPGSYSAELSVRVRVPKPHRDLEELKRLNVNLPELLPSLPSMLETARVSPFFEEIYRRKIENLRSNLNRLDALISRHNFFDTETVLELQHPLTKRRALLVQADMDVDEDGSDSDRVPEVDGSSVTFQPFTNYYWPKRTDIPNSFAQWRIDKVRQCERELMSGGLSPTRIQELKETVVRLKSEISDLKKYSYLVGSKDPFIVLPLSMFGKAEGGFTPSVGDYCVVAYGKTLYPAIVGDKGPTYKTGEGSLRLCKELNNRANSGNRPVSDLKVTYLVFPGTDEKPWGVPNLDRWRERCAKLLEELGGYQGELFKWEDLTKPKLPPDFIGPPMPPPVVGSTAAPGATPAGAPPKAP
jgi:hypothetical protein